VLAKVLQDGGMAFVQKMNADIGVEQINHLN
jgi:hypothetical protein